MGGASAPPNSSQLLLRRPAVSMPAFSRTSRAMGWGCWFGRGLLPAEKALKRPAPRSFSTASARMLRAELWVQRKRTFSAGVSVMVGS